MSFMGEGVLRSKWAKFGKMSSKNPLLCSFTDFLAVFKYTPHMPLFSKISSGMHTQVKISLCQVLTVLLFRVMHMLRQSSSTP